MTVASILDSRVSFDAALAVVTWAAIAFLAVLAMHLHLRLSRLERMNASAPGARPYANLVGARLERLLNGATAGAEPNLVLALSGACRTCEQVLGEVGSPRWRTPTLLLWTDTVPPDTVTASPYVTVAPDGPALAARLGIRITPFAMRVDENGTITEAGPVNSLRSFAGVNNGALTPQNAG